MNMSLKEIRAEWDKGEIIIAEIPVFVKNSIPQELDRLIVILKDPVRNKYHINRYFKCGDSSYHVSVDYAGWDAKEVLDYIEKEYPDGLKTNLM
jgi:hypothetical protein